MKSESNSILELGNIIETITPPKKIQTSEFLETGDYPIIDQSPSHVAGWTNDVTALVHPPKDGLIVFGDHTCVLKFETKPFAQGADGIKIIKLKKGINSHYVYAHLKAFPLLNDGYKRHFSELKRLKILIPDLKIQDYISAIHQIIDSKIAANYALSKTLEDIAQTIFKSWFIDFDPVKAKMTGEKPAGMDAETAALFPDSFEKTELGLIPSGWKATKLSSSLKLYKSTLKAGPSTEYVPYVPVDQIGARDIFLKNSMQGSEARTSLVSFKKNDILFGAMRPYFHKVVLAPFDGTTRTTTFVLRAINPHYLSHSLFTVYQESAVAYATNNSQGTTIPYAVWNNGFEDLPIVLPLEPIAKAFNDIVLPMLEFGYSLIAQNRSLVEIRDGLLPRLISGELQITEEMLAS